MLVIPKNSNNIFTILGIDPGSTLLGIALLFVNIDTLQIVGSNAWTINGAKLAGKDTWSDELYGNRVSRILAIEETLVNTFNYYQPLIISCESPFINSAFPAAGIALTEVLSTIRSAVMRYDVWHQLYLIPPSSVKNAVGAKGAAGKDSVKEKVLELDLKYNGDVPIQSLDEHSLDALAVAYSIYCTKVLGKI